MCVQKRQEDVLMKKESKNVELILKKAVNYMVDTELYGWPPQCTSFFYQPVRPQRKSKDTPKNSEKIRK